MEAEQITADEMGSESGKAEHGLWCAALALMVEDGKRYWQDKRSHSATPDELEEAFDALIQNTWMLRRICEQTGHDPQALSAGFNEWCLLN